MLRNIWLMSFLCATLFSAVGAGAPPAADDETKLSEGEMGADLVERLTSIRPRDRHKAVQDARNLKKKQVAEWDITKILLGISLAPSEIDTIRKEAIRSLRHLYKAKALERDILTPLTNLLKDDRVDLQVRLEVVDLIAWMAADANDRNTNLRRAFEALQDIWKARGKKANPVFIGGVLRALGGFHHKEFSKKTRKIFAEGFKLRGSSEYIRTVSLGLLDGQRLFLRNITKLQKGEVDTLIDKFGQPSGIFAESLGLRLGLMQCLSVLVRRHRNPFVLKSKRVVERLRELLTNGSDAEVIQASELLIFTADPTVIADFKKAFSRKKPEPLLVKTRLLLLDNLVVLVLRLNPKDPDTQKSADDVRDMYLTIFTKVLDPELADVRLAAVENLMFWSRVFDRRKIIDTLGATLIKETITGKLATAVEEAIEAICRQNFRDVHGDFSVKMLDTWLKEKVNADSLKAQKK